MINFSCRFDSELNKHQEETRSEKSLKEKLQRERDELMSEKFSLEKEVQRLRGDNESQADKYDRLQKELGEALAHSGAKDDHEVGHRSRKNSDIRGHHTRCDDPLYQNSSSRRCRD